MWEKRIIQRKYNQQFIQSEVDYFKRTHGNTEFKIVFLYGEAGSFKSSIQNIYMGQDLLTTSSARGGVTQGVVFCMQNNVILVDTEGLGTDNTSVNRPDIVSLLYFASAMIVTEKIYDRFLEKKVIDSIKAICQILDKIKENDYWAPRPRLEIVFSLALPHLENEINNYNTEAQNMLRNSELKDISKYFSNVSYTIINPLGEQLYNIIKKEKRELTQSQWPAQIKNKVNSIFSSALLSQVKTYGRNFEQFPFIYRLASGEIDAGSYSYDIILKTTNEAKQRYFSDASGTYASPDNFILYESRLNSLASSTRDTIECKFRLNQTIKTKLIENINAYIKEVNENLFSSFNDKLFTYCQDLIAQLKKSMDSGYMVQSQINEQKIYQEISKVGQTINSTKLKIDGLKYPSSRTTDSIRNKVNNLTNQEITKIKAKFVECYIALTMANCYKTEFTVKAMFSLGTQESLNSEISKRLCEYSNQLQCLVGSFLESNEFIRIRDSFKIAIEDFMKREHRNLVSPIYSNFQAEFQREASSLRNQVNLIISKVQEHVDRSAEEIRVARPALFDPIKEYGDIAVNLDNRLSTSFPQIYAFKYDEITQLTYTEAETVSILSSQKSFYSVEYVLCPHCNIPWELETNRNIAWHGCGNFTCLGNYSCKKVFRVFADKGNKDNPLARRISKDEFVSRYSTYINEMTNVIRNDIRTLLQSRSLGRIRAK